MLNKGVPKEVLQTLLGHRSIKTTEIYANWVRKTELEKWVEGTIKIYEILPWSSMLVRYVHWTLFYIYK